MLQGAAIIGKHGIQKATHVLDQDGAGTAFVDNAQHVGEQVPLVGGPQLLSGNRERRAGKAAGEQVDPPVRSPVEPGDVGGPAFADVPQRTVEVQCCAAGRVDLDQGQVTKARLFKAKGLPTRPRAKLDRIHAAPQMLYALKA